MGAPPGGEDEDDPRPEELFRRDGEAEDREVVVVGAGPAGSTAARYAAEGGADVLLVDRRAVVGKPVQCAGFLPSEAELLGMLPGVRDQEELYRVPEESVLDTTRESVMVSPRGRRKVLRFEGRTIDRAAWDLHLVERAVEAGAEFRPSTTVTGLESGVLATDRGAVVPSVVIAADGPNSRLRTLTGMSAPKLIAPALNAPSRVQHSGRVEMHFCKEAPGAYAWVIPAGEGMAHIGLGADPRREPADLKANLRAFAHRVRAELGPVTGGFVPSAGPVKRSVSGNVMLVGDAAGHVMASNGGGVPIALAAGRAAGQVAAGVVRGGAELSEYERRWRTEVGDVLATSARFRWLAGLSFWSPLAMELAMWAMPRSQMLRALKCQRLFYLF